MLNALLILVLIITGVSMQYTSKEGNILLVGFASSVKWHNIAAMILSFNYLIFFIGNIFTVNGRYYNIERKNFISDLVKQMRYYSFGMFKGEEHPFPVTMERKFNPLQKLSYVLIMYVAMPLVIISGLGLMFPEITVERVFGTSGLILTDILHITVGFFVSLFLVIHVYTCTLGAKPGTLFKSMLSGYHDSGH
jgi:thiosulfate reductase cytochrome b subunit